MTQRFCFVFFPSSVDDKYLAVPQVGSSSIRFWRLKKFFPEHHKDCLNRGFGGSGLPDLLHHFDRLVTSYQPRAVVLYSGENDLGHGASAGSVVGNLELVSRRILELVPPARLLVLPVKPSPMLWSRWPDMQRVNGSIKELAGQSRQLDTIDTATALLDGQGKPDDRFYMRDQLHLSQEAYRVWSDLVRPWLQAE